MNGERIIKIFENAKRDKGEVSHIAVNVETINLIVKKHEKNGIIIIDKKTQYPLICGCKLTFTPEIANGTIIFY